MSSGILFRLKTKTGGGAIPSPGFVFLVDPEDGAYLIDSDGYFIEEPI